MTRRAPASPASLAARSTAARDVSEPSVPTTTVEYEVMRSSLHRGYAGCATWRLSPNDIGCAGWMSGPAAVWHRDAHGPRRRGGLLHPVLQGRRPRCRLRHARALGNGAASARNVRRPAAL